MEILSLKEFKKICQRLSFKQFVFSSDNQSWNQVEHTIRISTTFSLMMITYNPNMICFKNNNGILYLDRVKGIKVSDAKSLLGTVFTIICGDTRSKVNDMEYTIVAR